MFCLLFLLFCLFLLIVKAVKVHCLGAYRGKDFFFCARPLGVWLGQI